MKYTKLQVTRILADVLEALLHEYPDMKPHDLAIGVKVGLDTAGLKIVSKPRRKQRHDDLPEGYEVAPLSQDIKTVAGQTKASK